VREVAYGRPLFLHSDPAATAESERHSEHNQKSDDREAQDDEAQKPERRRFAQLELTPSTTAAPSHNKIG
jgi:hypothetical protein